MKRALVFSWVLSSVSCLLLGCGGGSDDPAKPSGDCPTTDHDPIVRKAYGPRSGSTCGELIPTSNKIWWGNQNGANNTIAFASSALGTTGTATATVEASTAGTLPGAFTPAGDLWVIDRVASDVGLKRYAASALGSGGALTPSTVITSDALTASIPGPLSFTLDKAGNAWVGVSSDKVLEFAAADLASDGDVTPSVEISNVRAPAALAFDADGNLWASSDNLVTEYVASRLGASDSNPPDVSITSESPPPVIGALPSVLGLAFDATGNLWVNYDGVLAQIKKSQLVSGTITPEIQIAMDVSALPEGIALDESGGIWVASGTGKICKYGASQLVAANTGVQGLTPEVVITSSSIGSAGTPALFPAPAALPLYAALP